MIRNKSTTSIGAKYYKFLVFRPKDEIVMQVYYFIFGALSLYFVFYKNIQIWGYFFGAIITMFPVYFPVFVLFFILKFLLLKILIKSVKIRFEFEFMEISYSSFFGLQRWKRIVHWRDIDKFSFTKYLEDDVFNSKLSLYLKNGRLIILYRHNTEKNDDYIAFRNEFSRMHTIIIT